MIKTLKKLFKQNKEKVCRAEIGAGGHPYQNCLGGRYFPCRKEQIRKDIQV